MANVTGSVRSSIDFKQTPAAGFLNGVPTQLARTFLASFNTSGALADQANLVYANTLTFVASTPQTLDLSALTDIFGGAVAFARIRGIAIRINATTDTATLTIGAAASNPFLGFLGGTAPVLIVQASTANGEAFFILTAPNTTGMAVGSGVNLKLTPSAHAFTVDIIMWGANA